jgi:hypothetical protein
MSRVTLLGIIAVSLFVLAGCGSKTATINTGDGSVTVNSKNTNSWCQVGSDWNYQGGEGLVGEWKIKELIQGGKYDGLCHVTFSGQGMSTDYYFSENGEHGYTETTLPNGQKSSMSF